MLGIFNILQKHPFYFNHFEYLSPTMRNKNTVIALLLVFVGICAYNLYWTYVQFSSEAKLKSLRTTAVVDTVAKQQLDALETDASFQKNYQKSVENSFTLGLDLQGGMFVTLEVGVEDVVKELAGKSAQDSSFQAAIACASDKQETAQQNFVPLFVDCFKEIAPEKSLGATFAISEGDLNISVASSDDEVVTYLNEAAQSAIDQTFNTIRTRIDQFGVVSPTLQKQESTGRILLELPGVKEPERVRKLLRSTANLEFWTTHNTLDAYRVVYQLNEKLKRDMGLVSTDSTAVDSLANDLLTDVTVPTDTLQQDTAATDTGFTSFTEQDGSGETNISDADRDEQIAKFKRENPLFGRLQVLDASQIQATSAYPAIGRALARDTAKINEFLRNEDNRDLIPDDMVFSWTFKEVEEDTDLFDLIALKQMVLDGEKVTNARADFSQRGEPEVSMNMNVEGSREWASVTENNIGRYIAIVLDGYVYSYPVVNGRIPNGSSVIQGNFTIDETQDLSNVLKAGKLKVPARIEGEDVVGPSLGVENINRGWQSFIIAFVITLIFMAFYYAKSGLVANVALIANLIFILGCSAAFTIVLTVPGIAAVVLTVGMAVDANVLIFERIREEMARGKTLKASIKSGFSNAFSSVMDANITTFLTGVVLFVFGVGPIKGFAVSLMIGIVTSLISALVITRLILDYYANKGGNAINFGFPFTTGLFDRLKLNMVKRRKTFYGVSLVLVAAFLTSMFTVGFKTGVDFQGGRRFVVEFLDQSTQEPASLNGTNVEQARQDLTAVFENNQPEIKTLSSDNQLMITTSYLVDDRDATSQVQNLLMNGLEQNFSQYSKRVISSTDVGPTVAGDIRRAAVYSIVFSLIIIFLYILLRFRKWQYSLGAIVAIFHDVIIVLGVFSVLSLIDLPFSLEINQALIAALLTIIGYSINDTVVVFDRIRENIGEMKSSKLTEVYNTSIDQTISRTLITSFTTFLTALILFIFGGDVIKGFVFAIMIGIIVGTYSSIFVASPISLDLLKREHALEEAGEEKNSRKKTKA